jgi:quinolinate synthase
MLNTKDLQNEILKLKKEKDFCILAHAYQNHNILEIADFSGDSFGLSKKAAVSSHKNILMCGVRFMAETAKILSPDKRVILSAPNAGCPMAEQMTVDELKRLKELHKDAVVVAYINSTAELKRECDVCVTSSSALEIVKKIPQKEIIFIPDCNLGSWIKEQVPDKTFYFIDGGCPVHMGITVDDVLKAREKHPDALFLVHPECVKEVVGLSDYAGSTTGIMDFVSKSDEKEFIIGTENNIVNHLQYKYPDKQFYTVSKNCICKDMRLTTLNDVYNCLLGKGGEEIILSDEEIKLSGRCIDAMLEYGE